jgi:hypothetical protein
LRQRIAASVDRDATNQMRHEGKFMAETVANGCQDASGLINDFGADAVSGQ